jgi:hypothetical protein
MQPYEMPSFFIDAAEHGMQAQPRQDGLLHYRPACMQITRLAEGDVPGVGEVLYLLQVSLDQDSACEVVEVFIRWILFWG